MARVSQLCERGPEGAKAYELLVPAEWRPAEGIGLSPHSFGRRTCRLLLALFARLEAEGLNVVGIGQMQEVFDLADSLDGVGAAYVKFTGG